MTGLATLDWAVLLATIAAIVIYGAWRSSGVRDVDAYARGEVLRWPMIGLGIMATQASAITFLSLPGQAFSDGMHVAAHLAGDRPARQRHPARDQSAACTWGRPYTRAPPDSAGGLEITSCSRGVGAEVLERIRQGDRAERIGGVLPSRWGRP